MSRAPELPRLVNFSDSDMSTDSDEESREGSSANNVLPGNGTSYPYLNRPNTDIYAQRPGYSQYQGNPNNAMSEDKDKGKFSQETSVPSLQDTSFQSRNRVDETKSKFEGSMSRGKRSSSRGRRSRSDGRRSRSMSRSGSSDRRSSSSRRSASREERSPSVGHRSGSKGRSRSRSRGRRSGSWSRRSRSRGRRSGSRNSRSRRSGSRGRRSGSRSRRSGSRSRRSGSRSRRSGSRSRRSRSRSRDRRRRSRSGSRGRYRRRSRSRSRGRYRRSRSGSRRRKDRRHSSPYRTRRISPPRAHKTLDTLEKLGIELKPAAPPEEPEPVIPPYYNRLAVNPQKYAQQIAKRKLIWGSKTSEEGTAKASTWQGASFSQDQDGKVTAKFKRLMGIKQGDPSSSSSGEHGQELNKRQQELFSSMELQYEAARQATHTQRGVGLGFSSHPHHFPPS